MSDASLNGALVGLDDPCVDELAHLKESLGRCGEAVHLALAVAITVQVFVLQQPLAATSTARSISLGVTRAPSLWSQASMKLKK